MAKMETRTYVYTTAYSENCPRFILFAKVKLKNVAAALARVLEICRGCINNNFCTLKFPPPSYTSAKIVTSSIRSTNWAFSFALLFLPSLRYFCLLHCTTQFPCYSCYLILHLGYGLFTKIYHLFSLFRKPYFQPFLPTKTSKQPLHIGPESLLSCRPGRPEGWLGAAANEPPATN